MRITYRLSALLIFCAACSQPAGPEPGDGGAWDIGASDTASALDDVGVSAPLDVGSPADLGAPGLVVTPAVITTSESGGAAPIDVFLASPPREPVYVAVGPPSMEGSPTPVQLMFDAANFEVAQVVTVTGLDDQLFDGSQTYSLEFTTTSNDPRYDGLREVVVVTNQDNEMAGVAVSPVTLQVSGSGVPAPNDATFTVTLSSDPGESVSIDLENPDATRLAVSPVQLLFDSTNFGTPQTVTVTAADDGILQASEVVAIVTSLNATLSYAGVDPDDVAVTVHD